MIYVGMCWVGKDANWRFEPMVTEFTVSLLEHNVSVVI